MVLSKYAKNEQAESVFSVCSAVVQFTQQFLFKAARIEGLASPSKIVQRMPKCQSEYHLNTIKQHRCRRTVFE